MIEAKLDINVPTYDEQWMEGSKKYAAGDTDHPAARFYVREDIKQQMQYESQRKTDAVPVIGLVAVQLALFEAA